MTAHQTPLASYMAIDFLPLQLLIFFSMTSLVNCSQDNILDNPKGEARPHHSVSYNPASNVLVKSSLAAKKQTRAKVFLS